jgi:hypothetical protein
MNNQSVFIRIFGVGTLPFRSVRSAAPGAT